MFEFEKRNRWILYNFDEDKLARHKLYDDASEAQDDANLTDNAIAVLVEVTVVKNPFGDG